MITVVCYACGEQANEKLKIEESEWPLCPVCMCDHYNNNDKAVKSLEDQKDMCFPQRIETLLRKTTKNIEQRVCERGERLYSVEFIKRPDIDSDAWTGLCVIVPAHVMKYKKRLRKKCVRALGKTMSIISNIPVIEPVI